jgi:hypothetical protein
VADAARAGNECRALRLASSLREDVIAAEAKVPRRLRQPLVTGVIALADRFTCTQTATVPAQKEPKPPHEKHHGHHDHHAHTEQGDR